MDLKVTTNWGTDELQINISTISSADLSTFTCMDRKQMFSDILLHLWLSEYTLAETAEIPQIHIY